MTLKEAREVARSIAKIDSGGASVSLHANYNGEDFHFYSVWADGFYGHASTSWEVAIKELREKHSDGSAEIRARLEKDKKTLEKKIAALEVS